MDEYIGRSHFQVKNEPDKPQCQYFVDGVNVSALVFYDLLVSARARALPPDWMAQVKAALRAEDRT